MEPCFNRIIHKKGGVITMSEQEQKLKEAKYFYNEMVSKFKDEFYDEFKFNLSAFLTATRSILQYTFEYANQNGKTSDYNNLVSNNHILRFFKEKRDLNIHTQSIKPVQQVTLDLHATIRVRESIRMIMTHPDGSIVERAYSEDDSTTNHSKVNGSSPKRTLQYMFSDWNGDEDIILLSSKYLDELAVFIEGAKNNGLIN